MTYHQAQKLGYKLPSKVYERCFMALEEYNIESEKVYTASGRKEGQKYIILPKFDKVYGFRQYLVKA